MGYFHPSSGADCFPCQAGQYQKWVQESTCFSCPSGKYQDKAAYHLCHPCDGSDGEDSPDYYDTDGTTLLPYPDTGYWTAGLQGQAECIYAPTPAPTSYPTGYPTGYPTSYPTAYPTGYPTAYPTAFPTAYPTAPPSTGDTDPLIGPGQILTCEHRGNGCYCLDAEGPTTHTHVCASCSCTPPVQTDPLLTLGVESQDGLDAARQAALAPIAHPDGGPAEADAQVLSAPYAAISTTWAPANGFATHAPVTDFIALQGAAAGQEIQHHGTDMIDTPNGVHHDAHPAAADHDHDADHLDTHGLSAHH
jgi:hypothetical protein